MWRWKNHWKINRQLIENPKNTKNTELRRKGEVRVMRTQVRGENHGRKKTTQWKIFLFILSESNNVFSRFNFNKPSIKLWSKIRWNSSQINFFHPKFCAYTQQLHSLIIPFLFLRTQNSLFSCLFADKAFSVERKKLMWKFLYCVPRLFLFVITPGRERKKKYRKWSAKCWKEKKSSNKKTRFSHFPITITNWENPRHSVKFSSRKTIKIDKNIPWKSHTTRRLVGEKKKAKIFFFVFDYERMKKNGFSFFSFWLKFKLLLRNPSFHWVVIELSTVQWINCSRKLS